MKTRFRKGVASIAIVAIAALVPLISAAYVSVSRSGRTVDEAEKIFQARHYAQAILEGVARLNYAQAVSLSDIPAHLAQYGEKTPLSSSSAGSLPPFAASGEGFFGVVTTETTTMRVPRYDKYTKGTSSGGNTTTTTCGIENADACDVTAKVYYGDELLITLSRRLLTAADSISSADYDLNDEAGYYMLDTGHIIQWGTITIDDTGRTLLTFPYAWPESMEFISFLEDASDGTTSDTNFAVDLGGGMNVTSINVSGESVYVAGPAGRTALWMAAGY